jgi:hypothetical protein
MEGPGGGCRLWQILRRPTLVAEVVRNALRQGHPSLIGTTLFEAGRLLLDASQRFANAPCQLTCSAHTVARSDWRAVYGDLMPPATTSSAPGPREPDGVVVWRELVSLVPSGVLDAAGVAEACAAAQRMGARHPHLEVVPSMVAQLLLRDQKAHTEP